LLVSSCLTTKQPFGVLAEVFPKILKVFADENFIAAVYFQIIKPGAFLVPNKGLF